MSDWYLFVTSFFQTVIPTSPIDWIIFIGNVILALVVVQAIMMIFRLTKNKWLGFTTKPYSSQGKGGKRILIIGDSTAVGTGAAQSKDTIAGRLAQDFPNAEIVNKAQNGGLIRDLEEQVAELSNETFDLIIVSAGGNDVWHMTSLRRIRRVLGLVLPQLKQLSRQRVLFLLYNNIGAAPIFPAILRGFLTRRSQRVQATIRDVAEVTGVPTIDLFNDVDHNPFSADPAHLFAADGIHPSSDGYRLWYNRLWRKMVENGYRF